MTTKWDTLYRAVRFFLPALLLTNTLLISSCATRLHTQKVLIPEPVEPYVSRQLYFYSNKGQGAISQDRDRYECSLWAIDQSGLDPSSTALAPHQRIIVETQPPQGHNTVLGAASGAVLGAVVSSPHHTAGAAAIGAVVGAVIGAASDASIKAQADALQESYDQQAALTSAVIERQADNYGRALQACMEGRGYSVR